MDVLPYAFTQKIRRDSSWPLPIFSRSVCVFSHFPSSSGIQFLTSRPDGHWYSLFFCVCLFFLQLRHFFSSDQPMSYNLFCTHPLSTANFLTTFRCLSVHASPVFLRNAVWIGSLSQSFFQFLTSRPFHPIDHPRLLWKHFLRILRADHAHIYCS